MHAYIHYATLRYTSLHYMFRHDTNYTLHYNTVHKIPHRHTGTYRYATHVLIGTYKSAHEHTFMYMYIREACANMLFSPPNSNKGGESNATIHTAE